MAQAGRFDRRLSFERLAPAEPSPLNERGSAIDGEPGHWRPLAAVWARLMPRSASSREREGLSAGQIGAAEPQIFRIRYRRDITVRDRFLYEGRVYNIHDVREAHAGRRKLLEIEATAKQR